MCLLQSRFRPVSQQCHWHDLVIGSLSIGGFFAVCIIECCHVLLQLCACAKCSCFCHLTFTLLSQTSYSIPAELLMSDSHRYDPNGSPPRGEICIRGPLLFKEYYKDSKKTEEAMGMPPPPSHPPHPCHNPCHCHLLPVVWLYPIGLTNACPACLAHIKVAICFKLICSAALQACCAHT